MEIILESERLYFRKMNKEDFPLLSTILKDEETMYAYEGAFTDAEVYSWIARQEERYKEYGLGLWLMFDKTTESFIGQCGLTYQPWKGNNLLEVGYLLNRKYWKMGYAIEGAKACRDYAFSTLNASLITSIIRDNNFPSMRVAIRNGMVPREMDVKHYKGVTMPHILFSITKDEWTRLYQEKSSPIK